MKSQVVSKNQRRGLVIIFIFYMGIYFIELLKPIEYIGTSSYTYITKPLMFLCLFLFINYLPKAFMVGKIKYIKLINNLVLLNLGFLLIVYFIGGVVDGFGKSPYDHSFRGVITNLVYVLCIHLGRESTRNYFINTIGRKKDLLVKVLVIGLFVLTNFSISSYKELGLNMNAVNFFGEQFIPFLCRNILATYLVSIGGFVPGFLYMTGFDLIENLSPILPDLSWLLKTIIGTLMPLFSLSIIENIYKEEARLIKRNTKDEDSVLGWLMTSIVSVGIIWFAAGVFTIYPSVVATGSMEPMIMPGDITIMEKFDGNEAQVGDVVQFKRDNIFITHRIMEIDMKDRKKFITKGDNNSGIDTDPVYPEQIKGKIMHIVPKLGKFTLMIRGRNHVPIEEVEF